MQYRKLGKTGLMVSEIGFGGEWLERHEEEHSVSLLRYAHSRGINIFPLCALFRSIFIPQ